MTVTVDVAEAVQELTVKAGTAGQLAPESPDDASWFGDAAVAVAWALLAVAGIVAVA